VVLIVDDYELIRGSLGGPMKEAGFPGLTFASAEQFLTSREEKRTACLILDIRMPGCRVWNSRPSSTKPISGIAMIFLLVRVTKSCDCKPQKVDCSCSER
jgi:FixJ family two-component response regulator